MTATLTTLIGFDGPEGPQNPAGGVIADADGDLFGTTADLGGGSDLGTVFEIKKTAVGYATSPTILTRAGDGAFNSGLIADASGDLFGQSVGTALDPQQVVGTVFEIKKTGTGYATTPTALITFGGANFADGFDPNEGLIADANGDLLGTTLDGGANGEGTVFEITGSGFATAPPISTTVSNDILFQNVSGQAAIWHASGATVSTSALLGANPGPNWKIVGTGDFNNDPFLGILLQNANGQVAEWRTDGPTVLASGLVGANPGPNWKAVGTGDFDGDGRSDILLQNTNGSVAIWEMEGTSLKSSAVVANPGANWKVVGTGDLDDNGFCDIVLQNTNGSVAVWEMVGDHVGNAVTEPNPGPSWKVVGTGDFNGDNHADILFQNADGRIAIWQMMGSHLISSGIVSANPGPSWHAIGTNGGADILFQNTSGQTTLWDMSGTTVTGAGALSANAGPSWRAVGARLIEPHTRPLFGQRGFLVVLDVSLSVGVVAPGKKEHSEMDNRDCLAHYPFVVVRIRCHVCARRGSYRLARIAAKYGPEITLRDLLDRFSYDCLWRTESRTKRGGRIAACTSLTLRTGDRPTSRREW